MTRGHQVIGMDSMLFEQSAFGPRASKPDAEYRVDIRDAAPEHFDDVDAVIHLAGMSNDPAGDLNPEATFEINHRASTRIAELAKEAGVAPASCSPRPVQPLRRRHGDDVPRRVGRIPPGDAVRRVQGAWPSRTSLTNSPTTTFSADLPAQRDRLRSRPPRLRGDLVVNNLDRRSQSPPARSCSRATGRRGDRSCTSRTSRARVRRCSGGSTRELVHDEAFNVGATEENYTHPRGRRDRRRGDRRRRLDVRRGVQ